MEQTDDIRDYLPEIWKNFLEKDIMNSNIWDTINTKINISPEDIQPSRENIFRLFNLVSPDNIKIVIIGQDPYYNGLADGLSFSSKSTRIPDSLKTIYKELKREYPHFHANSADLSKWCEEGVFLLNRILTTTTGKSLAHANIGWETFTNYVIKRIDESFENIVYMLWGQKAKEIFMPKRGNILMGGHPSPINNRVPFIGCNHFIQANEFLISCGKLPIRWTIL